MLIPMKSIHSFLPTPINSSRRKQQILGQIIFSWSLSPQRLRLRPFDLICFWTLPSPKTAASVSVYDCPLLHIFVSLLTCTINLLSGSTTSKHVVQLLASSSCLHLILFWRFLPALLASCSIPAFIQTSCFK